MDLGPAATSSWESVFLAELLDALSCGDAWAPARVAFEDAAAWPASYAVSEFATACAAAQGVALAAASKRSGARILVNRRRASLWWARSIHPIGWTTPPAWDPLSGDYRASDGWVRLHCNDDGHRAAALRVLELPSGATKAAAAARVAESDAASIEGAIVDAGGAAAAMRSRADWLASPAGRAVASEPLIAWRERGGGAPDAAASTRDGGLAGLRVLDVTRVLAGPSATRWLAGLGASVLRIDPPFRDEPSLEPEMTVGKRCAGLDLRRHEDRDVFEHRLAEADIFIHGLRGGALDRLGYDEATLLRLNPSLIDIRLNAYGWTGPWAERRGFDSLVQMSAGLAEHGMTAAGAAVPTPLPIQALDYGAGALAGAAALSALAERNRTGRVFSARLSLARVAETLAASARSMTEDPRLSPEPEDLDPTVEPTFWGPAQRLKAPMTVDGVGLKWRTPAGPIRAASAEWPE